ncbi:hypothetical protein CHARACLAT_008711 [Characodon lateralis]|uniref:Uncharacterized protein n=1 Tax=Characodon lateralis TaxID=208331 RepID=A0ABU7ECF4_9TELE|nr:hypothetical protein [Characodon lateralis]
MDQYKRQVRVRRKSGFPYKRDTPIRPATRRRDTYKRHLAIKHYDSLPEEPEEEKINKPTVKPVSLVRVGTSMLRLSSSGFTENRRSQPASSVMSIIKELGHQKLSGELYPTVQAAVIPEVIKGHGTTQSGTSCIMEADSTLNSEDEDEDDDDDDYIYSSASTTLSSIPSPEIFRKETSVDTMSLPNEDELLGLHLHVKNSTLLEDSHAENIHMHHPPNLSTIIDASTVLAEKKCEISYHKTKEEAKKDISSCKSDQALKRKISPQLSERKPIFYKKKVWFKSPITTEIPEAKDITSCTPSGNNTSISSSPPQKIKPHPTTSRTSIISSKDETLSLAVTLKRPVKTCSQNAMFFHFENDGEGEAFLQKMRERSVILRSAVFLPLTLGSQNPQS